MKAGLDDVHSKLCIFYENIKDKTTRLFIECKLLPIPNLHMWYKMSYCLLSWRIQKYVGASNRKKKKNSNFIFLKISKLLH